MKKIILLLIIVSCAAIAYSAECPNGYNWCRMCANNCVQTNCNSIPHAHMSSTDYCICSIDDFIDDPANDKFSKSCRARGDDKDCPNCLVACVLPTDLCPGEVQSAAATGTKDNSPAKPTKSAEIQDINKAEEQMRPDWNNITKALWSEGGTVDYRQFLEYLRKVEEANPGMDWKKIITQLHAKEYPHDINDTVPLFGNHLFVFGNDTNGYERVNIATRFVPRFVVGRDGKLINIAHSYAGLRSDLNRRGVGAWFMRHVNTHWGDTWQVITNFDSSWAPPDQRLGNDVGLWLSDYYKNPDHKNTPLSTAYRGYFYK